MSRKGQIVLVAALLAAFALGCYVYFRAIYEHSKRLRIVQPGRFYRSGQMTAAGFADAVALYHIRTIINVQDEFPNPDIQLGAFNRQTIKESDLCRQLGVNYVWLSPDLKPRSTPGGPRPAVLDEYLALLDDPNNYPVLIHCKAGLHRTGVLTAVYRMEYQGWSRESAFQELKANGFGDTACTSANDYVSQYVLTYQTRQKLGLALRRPY